MLGKFMTWFRPPPVEAGRFEIVPVGRGPRWCWRHVAVNGAVTMWSSGSFVSAQAAQQDIRQIATRANGRVDVKSQAGGV